MDQPSINPTQSKAGIWGDPRKKTAILISLIILVIVTLAIVLFNRYTKNQQSVLSTDDNRFLPSLNIDLGINKQEEIKYFSHLDGTQTTKDLAKRRPLAVMIENHPDARPQIGLNKASHVWEAIVEGGITRFMAVFSSQDVEKIGPVRSARPFYIAWASGYNALYTHAGGSQGALALLSRTKDVVDLPHTNGYFWREPQAGLASEHTLFTSTGDLYKFADKKGASIESKLPEQDFTEEISLDSRPTTAKLTINFSSDSYKVDWEYDRDNNNYKRNLAGAAHKDRASGDQLVSKNIVVLEIARSYNPNVNQGKGEWTMTTEGTGNATVYHNGRMIKGTWIKTNTNSVLELKDTDGNQIKLLRGNAWFEVIPPETVVEYATS